MSRRREKFPLDLKCSVFIFYLWPLWIITIRLTRVDLYFIYVIPVLPQVHFARVGYHLHLLFMYTAAWWRPWVSWFFFRRIFAINARRWLQCCSKRQLKVWPFFHLHTFFADRIDGRLNARVTSCTRVQLKERKKWVIIYAFILLRARYRLQL